MTIKIKVWPFVVALLLSTYPLNYHLMKKGSGFYNNDPNCTWVGDDKQEYKGPDLERRVWCLISSPVTAPVNTFAWIAQSTFQQQPEEIKLK